MSLDIQEIENHLKNKQAVLKSGPPACTICSNSVAVLIEISI